MIGAAVRLACRAGLAAMLATGSGVAALDDGLARTPPMAWSSWYGLECRVDDASIRAVADALVTRGLAAVGYTHVNLDDCWGQRRAADGSLTANARRFPGGIKPLADYVHERGLKFGIYTSAGTTTCQDKTDGHRLPIGSRGHEYQDARSFAAWGADFVKVDWCGHYETQDGRSSYETWRDAIAASGRPMLLSICEWGLSRPWEWGPRVGHQWRTTQDILNCWDCTTDWGGLGVVHVIDRIAAIEPRGRPGGWNDPDNLEVGNGVLTADEARAQMSIWAIAAAPLIFGADPRTLDAVSLAILTNVGVIAVDQDPAGTPGHRVRDDGEQEVWVRDLAGGDRAVVLLNRAAAAASIAVTWRELGLGRPRRIRDLWRQAGIDPAERFAATVPPHGVVMLRLTPTA